MNKLYFGNNLDVLRESIKDETIDLIRVLNDEILPHGAKIISALVPDVIIGRPKGGAGYVTFSLLFWWSGQCRPIATGEGGSALSVLAVTEYRKGTHTCGLPYDAARGMLGRRRNVTDITGDRCLLFTFLVYNRHNCPSTG